MEKARDDIPGRNRKSGSWILIAFFLKGTFIDSIAI